MNSPTGKRSTLSLPHPYPKLVFRVNIVFLPSFTLFFAGFCRAAISTSTFGEIDEHVVVDV